MDEVIWYSRLGVWAGVVVLLLQSLTSRGGGLVTVVAVGLLTVGFGVFLITLALEGLQSHRLPEAGKQEPPSGGPSKP